ncbi:MAG: hypothetical protein ACRD1O_00825 [Terriglobia bacterium]
MGALAKGIFFAHPLETMLTTLQGALYNAFAPMRSELDAWLLIERRGHGLNRKEITIGAIETVVSMLLRSPLMTALVAFQVLVLLALWIGVGAALARCFKLPGAYRTWTIYLTFIALLFIGLAAGGEACQRFRVPVIPLLAIATRLGYFGSAVKTS